MLTVDGTGDGGPGKGLVTDCPGCVVITAGWAHVLSVLVS